VPPSEGAESSAPRRAYRSAHDRRSPCRSACRVHNPHPLLTTHHATQLPTPRLAHRESRYAPRTGACASTVGDCRRRASRRDVLGSDGAAARVCGISAAVGAKLEAIRRGLVWTAVDGDGHGSHTFRHVWTAVDGCGHCLEIYGSEGCSWTAWPQSAERFRGVIATLPRGVEFRSCCRESKADRGLTNRMISRRTDRHASSCRAWDASCFDRLGSGHGRSSTCRRRDLG